MLKIKGEEFPIEACRVPIRQIVLVLQAGFEGEPSN